MSWLKEIVRPKIVTKEKKDIPSSLWIKCDSCKDMLYYQDVEENLNVCPSCGYHLKVSFDFRKEYLFDKGSIEFLPEPQVKKDPLDFKDIKKYTARLQEAKSKTKLTDAIKTFTARINDQDIVVCNMDFSFMAGSMGAFVGQSIIDACDKAIEKGLPLMIITASGGARMQEGILSLMQMARTTVAVEKLKEHKLPFLIMLTNPTTGGVTASFAMLGDITMAEPGALIGFAGKRVIEQTIGEKLPDGFQSAEYLEEKGMIDVIVPRQEQKQIIANLITMLMNK
ncbi:MAG TPA: acetyl-CoA carboxylase carboxyl transferase subunit beta [Alphaproteobacteria bacterium]|nr:acetyl-CoA carboxylase carboxyl transferase subunit beta [Alphaproteobacteria bacterium]